MVSITVMESLSFKQFSQTEWSFVGFSRLFMEFFNLQFRVALFDLKCPFLSSYIFYLCPAPNEKIFEKSESSSLNLLVAQLYLFVP